MKLCEKEGDRTLALSCLLTHYCVDGHLSNMHAVPKEHIFKIFSIISEAHASEIIEILEEIFPRFR